MKTIGLLCGLSWLSTKIYYDILNRRISQELKGVHSARMIMNSLNAESVVSLLKSNHLNKLEVLLKKECLKLQDAGCDFIALTCNTVHAFYNSIQDILDVPIIHIMDSVVHSLAEKNLKKVGILGTEFTIKNKLYDNYLRPLGIDSVYPNQNEVNTINNIIFKVCSGDTPDCMETKAMYAICDKLKNNGVEAIILGCTELGLILEKRNDIPLLDSAVIHAEDLASYSMKSNFRKLNLNHYHPWSFSDFHRELIHVS